MKVYISSHDIDRARVAAADDMAGAVALLGPVPAGAGGVGTN